MFAGCHLKVPQLVLFSQSKVLVCLKFHLQVKAVLRTSFLLETIKSESHEFRPRFGTEDTVSPASWIGLSELADFRLSGIHFASIRIPFRSNIFIVKLKRVISG